MSHTYTKSNATVNTGNTMISGSGTSIGGYGAIPPLTSSQIYTISTGAGGAGSASTFGGAGQFLTSTGTNGINWATTSPTDVMIVKQNPSTLEVKGNVVINGRDLEERLDAIEKVLQIPERDVKLERKHPKLKKLHDEYIKELSKYRMWNAIKGDE